MLFTIKELQKIEKMFKIFRKFLDFLLIILVLIYIVLEEIIWEKIARPIINKVLKLEIFDNLTKKIENLNSIVILVVFLIFFIFVELLGVYSAIVFVQGKIFFAIFIYFLKLPLAIIILWFFSITKEKLLEFYWFKVVYNGLLYVKNQIKLSRVYILIYNKVAFIKEYFKSKISFSKYSIKNRTITIYRVLKDKWKF